MNAMVTVWLLISIGNPYSWGRSVISSPPAVVTYFVDKESCEQARHQLTHLREEKTGKMICLKKQQFKN